MILFLRDLFCIYFGLHITLGSRIIHPELINQSVFTFCYRCGAYLIIISNMDTSSVSLSCASPPWFGAVGNLWSTIVRRPHHNPPTLPLYSSGAWLWVGLFDDDYVFLHLAGDLGIDLVLSPGAVPSDAFA
jgi:hypothetical protein